MNEKKPIADILQKLMNKRGVETIYELSGLVNVDQPTLWRIIHGNVRNPRIHTVLPLLEYFGISYGQLVGTESLDENEPNNVLARLVPIIDWTQVKRWEEVLKDSSSVRASNTVPVSKEVGLNSFALKVHSDSMEPIFPIGCTIIVDPEFEHTSGSYVIAQAEGAEEATFKKLIIDGADLYLKPLNGRYPVSQLNQETSIVGVIRHMFYEFE